MISHAVCRVLYYKAAIDGKLVDNAIANWTWLVNLPFKFQHKLSFNDYNLLKCSHVEIWTPEEHPEFGDRYSYIDSSGKLVFTGQCWTSTMGQVGGKHRTGSGIRVAPASEILKHPERWFYNPEFVSRDLNPFKSEKETDRNRLKHYMSHLLLNNKGYDTAQIFRYFGFKNAGSLEKYICSEFVNESLGVNNSNVPSESPSPFRIALEKYLDGTLFLNVFNDTLLPLKLSSPEVEK